MHFGVSIDDLTVCRVREGKVVFSLCVYVCLCVSVCGRVKELIFYV